MLLLGYTYETAQSVRVRLRDAAAMAGERTAAIRRDAAAHQVPISCGDRSLTITACRERAGQRQGDSLFAALDRYAWILDGSGADGADLERLAAGTELSAHFRSLTRFNELEMADIAQLNPLIYRVAADFAGREFGNAAVLIRDHALLEKLNLVRALLNHGIPAHRLCFLSKPDNTRYRERTLNSMRDLGVTVVENANRTDFADVCERMFSALESAGPGRLIAVDDGGELIEYLLDGGPRRVPFISVETTAKGMKLLSRRGYGEAVVNLSDCHIKSRLSRAIASSCVNAFWRLMAHEPLDGQWCHVIGFGRIGSQVASMLSALGMRISVSEPRADRRGEATAAGFLARESVEECLREIDHRYVFGCSGETAMGPTELKLLGGRTVMASISSQDFRLLRAELEGDGARLEPMPYGDSYTTSGGREVVVLGDGHAINLFRSEGVPEPDFDAFCALVLGVCLELLSADPASTQLDPEVVAERVGIS